MDPSNLKKNTKNNKNTNIRFIFSVVLCILTAFVCGNVFGISTKYLGDTKGLSFFTICGIEFISFLKYSKYFRTRVFKNNYYLFYINSLKRGFLIGLFIEAFKVGS